MTVAERLQHVQAEIAAACDRAGRSPSDVTLIAVSKTHPVERVLEVAAAGVQHFGENRVEESESKIPAVNARAGVPLTWHMIGHIQSRKAKDVVDLFSLVHSIDSLKLAAKLSALMVERGRDLDVLLEVNVSGEASKYGLAAVEWAEDRVVRDALWAEVGAIMVLPGLNVRGLMTVAPIVSQVEEARPVFSRLARLRGALVDSFGGPLPELSMGMSDDFQVAIEEGSTMVRIGRAIFGERHL